MKCIFIDIDGTLYNHKKNEVPASSLEAIKKLKENGNKVFICTGRSLSESIKYINIDVDGFVFCAGSVIYVDKKLIYKKQFEVEEIKRIIKEFDKYNLGYCLDGDAGAYNNKIGMEHVRGYFKGEEIDEETIDKEVQANCFFDMNYWDERDSICKICLYGKGSIDLSLVEGHLNFYTLTNVSGENNDSYCIEITHKNHNKSTAAKKILEHYGLNFSDAVAIGDSYNDYEIIKDCKVGIAMGNGHSHIKEIADYVTDDINENGLYKAFEKYNFFEN